MRLRELAMARPRYGYRRLYILIRRDGWKVNHKRVFRVYREEGLQVRTVRRRKKATRHLRILPPNPTRPNERWTIDFVSDALSNGRKIRALTVLDIFTRECLAIEVAHSIPSARVTEVLDGLIGLRKKPMLITLDNGTEFTCNHFDAWAYARKIHLDFINPGNPIENSFIESFNGKLRDECLNEHWFTSLEDARETIESWREEYNNTRPHSSLNNLAPMQFVEYLRALGVS